MSILLCLGAGLSACQGQDEPGDALEAANQEVNPEVNPSVLAPGTVVVDGGTVVVVEGALEVRADGASQALVLTPDGDGMIASWDGQQVNPEAELPAELAEAIDLAERALADHTVLDQLRIDQPVLNPDKGLIGFVQQCQATGCSGQICASEPVFTTCEWRAEYECLQYTTCGNNGPGWSCGWAMTPKYVECLASVGNAEANVVDAQIAAPESPAVETDSFCGCVSDDDCIKTTPGCCPCNAGGQEIAVAKQCSTSGPKCDPFVQCPQVYLCTDSEAVCEAGECVLSKGSLF
ncbi:hypothetical protein [Enhygromyxa salina]|nr:hypothetical protein [Enhygromyxa salina]